MSSVMNGLSYILLLRDKSNSFVSRGLYVYTLVTFMRYIWVCSIRIKMIRDTEIMKVCYPPLYEALSKGSLLNFAPMRPTHH